MSTQKKFDGTICQRLAGNYLKPWNMKHYIWPHVHFRTSNKTFFVVWLNNWKLNNWKLNNWTEEHMGFSKAIILTKSWTYCKISLVTLNQVSQFVQKSPPVWCIHCSPRTAQFEGLLGCFYSNINVCLNIRFKATSNKFEFKILASKLLKFTAPSVSAKLYSLS